MKKIFGSDKVIDAGINSIDAMFYTDEEKSQSKKDLLKLYEPYKLAQRVLAFAVSFNFFVFMWVCVYAIFCGESGQLDELLGLAKEFQVGYLMMLIMTWYFTDSIVGAVRKK